MRRVTLFRLMGVLAAACALGACEEDPVKPPPVVIPSPTEPIVYSRHVAPIFANGCAGSGCHIGSANVTGLRLDSWTDVMITANGYGAQVVPFNAAKSHLFRHINTDTTIAPTVSPRMPLGRDALPKEQIEVIRRWIEEGARDDNGTIAFAGAALPRVFVTAQSDDYITAVDMGSMHVMRYITVGTLNGGAPEAPHNITVSPDKRYLYVNLIAGGTVEKYDARTFEKLASVRVGLSPAQIAVTRNGAQLYVSNFDKTGSQRFIVRVDAAWMTLTDTIFDVGEAPHGITLSPDERQLYTCNPNGDDITVVDIATLEVVRRIPISPGNPLGPGQKPRNEPYQSVISADGKTLWVTCRASAELRVIDLEAGRVVDSIAVGKTPLILEMTPDGRSIWVPNQGANTISVVDVATRSVSATIDGLEAQPHAVAFTADGKRAFISCENQSGSEHHPTMGSARAPGVLYTVDVATRAILRDVEIGSFAAGIAIVQ